MIEIGDLWETKLIRAQISDKPVCGSVGDHEVDLGGFGGGLRGDATGPEDGDEVVGNVINLWAVKWGGEVCTDLFRIPDMDRSAVIEWETAGHLGGFDGVFRGKPSHGNDEVAVEHASRFRGALRTEDPAVAFVGGDADSFEGLVKGDPGTDKKTDEIVLPQMRDLRRTVDEFSGSVDVVFGEIRSQICLGGDAFRFGRPDIGDLKQRAGSLISLAVEEEIVSVGLFDDDEVALDEAGSESVGNLLMLTRANDGTGGLGGTSWIAGGHFGAV